MTKTTKARSDTVRDENGGLVNEQVYAIGADAALPVDLGKIPPEMIRELAWFGLKTKLNNAKIGTEDAAGAVRDMWESVLAGEAFVSRRGNGGGRAVKITLEGEIARLIEAAVAQVPNGKARLADWKREAKAEGTAFGAWLVEREAVFSTKLKRAFRKEAEKIVANAGKVAEDVDLTDL